MRTTINAFIVILLAFCQSSETVAGFATERPGANVSNANFEGMTCEKQNEDKETCDATDALAEDMQLAQIAIAVCFSNSSNVPQKYTSNAIKLLKMERELKIPDSMRGMTLAAACAESGFNENAEGDHRFSRDGKTPKAIGILQMWPFYEKAYKVNRRDVESAANGWLTHIARQVPSVAKSCKTKTESDTWLLAWLHGVRGPKKGGRCKESTYHWRVFRKIRKGALVSNT